jgi:hypothetical protein
MSQIAKIITRSVAWTDVVLTPFTNIVLKHPVAPICQLFHTIYISVTNATKGYSHSFIYSLFTTCFGHILCPSCVCRCAKLLYYTACHNCMWLVIGTPKLKSKLQVKLKYYFKIGEPY